MRPRKLAGKEDIIKKMWESGASYEEIAAEMGVANSTMLLELDRLGLREQPTDLVIRREFERSLQTDSFYEALGFAWGIGSKVGDRFKIRHHNEKFVKHAAINIPFSSYFHLNAKDRDHHVCQFGLTHPMYQYMISLGWKGRHYEDRPFPKGDINELAFAKGFVKAHYTYDSFKNKKRIVPRFRIYGGKNILEEINRIFHENLGTTVKTVQRHGRSNVCHILFYTAKKEVAAILDFLKDSDLIEEKREVPKMEIKDVTDKYVTDGKINVEALKKDYPKKFVSEIMKKWPSKKH